MPSHARARKCMSSRRRARHLLTACHTGRKQTAYALWKHHERHDRARMFDHSTGKGTIR
jgi:hypothetical protein